MWDSCLDEFLINRKFCCHDGVVCRCEYCIHAICDQCFCCKLNFIGSGSGTFYIFDSLLIQVIFLLPRWLIAVEESFPISYKKSDLLGIRIYSFDQFHNGSGIQIIACSGKICTRCLQGLYKTCTNRIRYC